MSDATVHQQLQYDSKKLSKRKQLELYRAMLRPRLVEEKMLSLPD